MHLCMCAGVCKQVWVHMAWHRCTASGTRPLWGSPLRCCTHSCCRYLLVPTIRSYLLSKCYYYASHVRYITSPVLVPYYYCWQECAQRLADAEALARRAHEEYSDWLGTPLLPR